MKIKTGQELEVEIEKEEGEGGRGKVVGKREKERVKGDIIVSTKVFCFLK